MQSKSESLTFTVPLGLKSHTLAEKFCRQHSNPSKRQQVYVNTLAVAAVKFYLHCIGWETVWENCHSYNPIMQGLIDVADLQLRGLGKLECRPVLVSSQTLCIPPEVCADRIGYIAVQLDESLKTAKILGFTRTATNGGEILLSELESLADFILYLNKIKQCQALKPQVNLSGWFNNIFDNGWMAFEEIFLSIDEKKFALRNIAFLNENSVTRAKIIDVGLELGNQSLVLLVAIAPYLEQKLEILVQLHPKDERTYLPSHLRLKLLSESGELIQDIESRNHDNYMQLKRFRGYPGEGFNIQVLNGDFMINESFVI